METDEVHYYKYDTKLILSHPNFGTVLQSDRYNYETAKDIAFPADYELAKFSQIAYQNTCLPPDGWELLTTASNPGKTNGYFGAAFWNPTHCQVVVAHRGTETTNIGSLIADLQLGLLNKGKSKQSQSASTFTYIVSEQVRMKGPPFRLSITGHSLGAWLAQVSCFTAKYFKEKDGKFIENDDYASNLHAHNVVFESPGCREALHILAKKFVPRYVHRKFANYDCLDMTVYLSKPNFINSINHHVGTIYTVSSQTHSIEEIVKLLKHSATIKEVILDCPSGKYTSCKLFFQSIIQYNSGGKRVLKKLAKSNECSLNVFTDNELEFVKQLFCVAKQNSQNIKKFIEEHCIPDFDIDYDYHLLISECLNKTIARVKHLQPTESTVFELLETDAIDSTNSAIFELESRYFKDNLLEFAQYYFKDKYGLCAFLQTDDQILHVRVDKNSDFDYELETSILNNVLKYYEQVEFMPYCFLSWHHVYKLQRHLAKILGKKINLLIVECFEIEENDKQRVLDTCKFISKKQTKIVLLTTNQFSFGGENGVVEVTGYGSDIKFQYLTDDSQNKFLMEENLQLYERKISLHDITDITYPLNEEMCRHLNNAILPRTLIALMLTPFSETLIINGVEHSLLQNVIHFKTHEEFDVTSIMSKQFPEKALLIIEDSSNFLQNYQERQNIKIKEVVDFEKECLGNMDKVVYYLKFNGKKLELVEIFNTSFYIPRSIILTNTVSPLIFNNLNEEMSNYYFCGDKNKYTEMISYLNEERATHFHFVNSEEVGKNIMKRLNINSHLLHIDSSTIKLLYSQGSMSSLFPYMQSTGTTIEESEIVTNAKYKLVIISEEAGMGKSSTIGHLFFLLKKTHWTFVIPLKHAAFDDISDEINFQTVANFLLKNCKISNANSIQHLLSYCLKHPTKLPIYIMLDAFDEIDENLHRQHVIDLVNFLKECSTSQILVTTRKYRCKELENGISAFAAHYKTLDYETEMTNFFAEFFYSQLQLYEENINVDHVKGLLPNVLAGTKNIFGESVIKFIGVPIQMRMIAEITQLSDLHASSQNGLTDILSLYQKYTEFHCNVYFKKYGIFNKHVVKRWLVESITHQLYTFAIFKIFDLPKYTINYEDIEELNKVGLIQSTCVDFSNLEFDFLHDSVRDYFLANFLSLWLKDSLKFLPGDCILEKFLVSDFLTEDKFKEVRLFLNYLIEDITISNKRLEICSQTLSKLWKTKKDILCNQSTQESAIHICIKEGLFNLMKYFALQIVDVNQKRELLTTYNSDLETPLILAIIRQENDLENNKKFLLALLDEINGWQSGDDKKAVLCAALFSHTLSDDHINKLSEYLTGYKKKLSKIFESVRSQRKSIPEFHEMCASNDLEGVKKVLGQFHCDKVARDYLLLATNDRKQICLHLTDNIKIVDNLLKLGCNKNLQDYHGMTPLTRALKKKNIDIARTLIKKGALLTPDRIGNTPLHHAAKYNNLEIVRLLLGLENPKVDIDKQNVFEITPLMLAARYGNEHVVKLLIEKGANVLATDWNGMTSLFHGVKGNHANLVKIFRSSGADLNIQSYDGATPLLYSIKKQKWDMVNSLIDNGANINIRSTSNVFPIQLLIEKSKRALIKKVLKRGIIETKEGTSFREPARTDMLSEQELQYINSL